MDPNEYYYNPPTKFDQLDQDEKPVGLLLCSVIFAATVIATVAIFVWATS